ncbi:MAG: carbon-nitrogen hydrolase family protein, partial [Planctomycetes bacterium]|nr:carbon-nitrogen hydrolase family protein [Planctomycetota bacterium]
MLFSVCALAPLGTLLVLCMGGIALGEQKSGRVVNVSTLCFLDTDEGKKLDCALGMIRQAALRQRNDLIVTPLMPFLSFREGQEADDLKAFAALAREFRTHIAVAMAETGKDGRKFHSAVLLDRNGGVVGKYRKTHALPDDDGLALGDDLPVFKTDFGLVGLSLSTDFYFPEVYW